MKMVRKKLGLGIAGTILGFALIAYSLNQKNNLEIGNIQRIQGIETELSQPLPELNLNNISQIDSLKIYSAQLIAEKDSLMHLPEYKKDLKEYNEKILLLNFYKGLGAFLYALNWMAAFKYWMEPSK
jgi:hypothetical protein